MSCFAKGASWACTKHPFLPSWRFFLFRSMAANRLGDRCSLGVRSLAFLLFCLEDQRIFHIQGSFGADVFYFGAAVFT